MSRVIDGPSLNWLSNDLEPARSRTLGETDQRCGAGLEILAPGSGLDRKEESEVQPRRKGRPSLPGDPERVRFRLRRVGPLRFANRLDREGTDNDGDDRQGRHGESQHSTQHQLVSRRPEIGPDVGRYLGGMPFRPFAGQPQTAPGQRYLAAPALAPLAGVTTKPGPDLEVRPTGLDRGRQRGP